MYILESVLNSSTGRYKIGYWQHSADLTFNHRNFSYNYGYYAIIDLGLHIHGLIPKRHNDDLGIAYIQADTRTGNEKVIELTYRSLDGNPALLAKAQKARW